MNCGYYYMMSLFSNKESLLSELESWKGFANSFTLQQDGEVFKKLLSDYQNYIDLVLSADINKSFPSEHLITALIIAQQKKMISWLIYKLSEYNETYWWECNIPIIGDLLLGCSRWNYGDSPENGGWSGVFYPDAKTKRLCHNSQFFDVTESYLSKMYI